MGKWKNGQQTDYLLEYPTEHEQNKILIKNEVVCDLKNDAEVIFHQN